MTEDLTKARQDEEWTMSSRHNIGISNIAVNWQHAGPFQRSVAHARARLPGHTRSIPREPGSLLGERVPRGPRQELAFGCSIAFENDSKGMPEFMQPLARLQVEPCTHLLLFTHSSPPHSPPPSCCSPAALPSARSETKRWLL